MKVTVLSQFNFDERMKKMGLSDDNVEEQNSAFISIIGTPECLNYYLDEGDTAERCFHIDHRYAGVS